MELKIGWEYSFDIEKYIENFYKYISHISQFANNNLDVNGIDVLSVRLNCIGDIPGMPKSACLITGFVFGRRYIKKHKKLELDIDINSKEVKKGYIIPVVSKIISSIFEEINAINSMNIENIKNRLLGEIIDIDTNKLESISVVNYSKKMDINENNFQDKNDFLNENSFWEIIDESVLLYSNNLDRTKHLVVLLSTKENEFMFKFELSLRRILKKMYNPANFFISKIVTGYLSDDSFLYFCCHMIMMGQLTLNRYINNPNDVDWPLKVDQYSELLLSVADNAFEMKGVDNLNLETPSEIGSNYFDYDIPVSLDFFDKKNAIIFYQKFAKIIAKYSLEK